MEQIEVVLKVLNTAYLMVDQKVVQMASKKAKMRVSTLVEMKDR